MSETDSPVGSTAPASGPASPTVSATARLEELASKYGVSQRAASQAFDSAARPYLVSEGMHRSDLASLRRLSAGPRFGQTDTGSFHAAMAEIQLDLAELADEYGELNVDFRDLLRKEGWGILDIARYAVNSIPVVGNKKTARAIKLGVATRRGDSIAYLVDKMGIVLDKQHEKARDGYARSLDLQRESVAELRRLDQKLIANLRSGTYRSADMTSVEVEVGKLERDLNSVQEMLVGYENQIRTARAAGNVEEVTRLTDEMSKLLDVKYAVLEGKLTAEGTVSEVRRTILDSAEAVQSAKGAIAASWVNYRAATALADALGELEIKYRHAMEDFVPVFKTQGKIAATGMLALDVRDTLVRVAAISERLMDENAKLVTHLAVTSFELLKTPIYDPQVARAKEAELTAMMQQVNALKMEWAQATTSLAAPVVSPGYVKAT